MGTVIRQKRIESGLTLREIARALGPGFSLGKLSMGERGVIKLSARDEATILAVIRRLAPLSNGRRRIIKTARDMNLATFVADMREGRVAAA